MRDTEIFAFWTKVLDLPGLEVVHTEEDKPQQRLCFTLVPVHDFAVCPQCGELAVEVHQRRTRERIRDLPIGSCAVELQVRVPQLYCAACARAFTPAVPGLAEGAHATERFLGRAAQLIRTSDVANAAAFFGVPEKTLEDWYYGYVERQRQQPQAALQPIRSLGVDELSLKKSTANLSPC